MNRSLLPLLLLAAACGGQDPRDGDMSAAPPPAPEARAAPDPAPAPPAAGPGVEEARRTPQVMVMAVDSAASEETPVVARPVFRGAPRTFVEGGVLHAAADSLLPAAAPGRRVAVEGERVTLDGRALDVPVRRRGSEAYVPVRDLARRLGAYAQVNEVDGSITLWPRDVLLYWREHGDATAPVIRAAEAEGLIPARAP